VRPTLIRILKGGVPTAVALFAIGLLLAEMASVWVSTATPPPRPAVVTEPGLGSATDAPPVQTADDLARSIRVRLPLGMALWGFAVVAAFELLLAVWRGGKKPPAPAPSPRAPAPADVDALLSQLLAKAEADRARAVDTTTPPPAGFDGDPAPAAGVADGR
jgi:hypothetical protein